MMINNTGIPKGMSLSHMKHIAVLFVFTLKFTYVKIGGPNKFIQPQKNKVLQRKKITSPPNELHNIPLRTIWLSLTQMYSAS